MKIWRVEDPDTRRGPFSSTREAIYEDLYFGMERASAQPTPSMEGLDSWQPSYKRCIYGTQSFDKLIDWFGADDLHKLIEYGYEVRVYDVPDKDCTVLPSGQVLADVNYDQIKNTHEYPHHHTIRDTKSLAMLMALAA